MAVLVEETYGEGMKAKHQQSVAEIGAMRDTVAANPGRTKQESCFLCALDMVLRRQSAIEKDGNRY